jgi:hypothetical protein
LRIGPAFGNIGFMYSKEMRLKDVATDERSERGGFRLLVNLYRMRLFGLRRLNKENERIEGIEMSRLKYLSRREVLMIRVGTIILVLVGLIICSGVLGCASLQRPADPIRIARIKDVEEMPVAAEYKLGLFYNDPNKFGRDNIQMEKIDTFLELIRPHHRNDEIISIDGLKWIKWDGYWHALANPPQPILEPGEDPLTHAQEYFKWCHDHPHLELPPSPPVPGTPQGNKSIEMKSYGTEGDNINFRFEFTPILPALPPSLPVLPDSQGR